VAAGIYLAIYSVSDATIERLHAHPQLAWRVMDPRVPSERPKRALRETVSAVASRGLGLLVSIS
jgi:hypothetical protein